MKKLLSVAALAAAFTLGGCAGYPQPTPEQLEKANYGNLTPQRATEIVRAYLNETLIDPQSLILKGPTRMDNWWLRLDGGGFMYGQMVRYSVNAKNRMGGYTGSIPKGYFIANDRIVETYTIYTDGPHNDRY